MKYIKKFTASAVSCILLFNSPISVLAENVEITETQLSQNVEVTKPVEVFFKSVSGVIKEISLVDTEGDKKLQFLSVEDENKELCTLVVSSDTFLVNENPIEVDKKVLAFYDAQAPMLAIYPPRYSAAVLAVDMPEDVSIKVDRFDSELVSSDNELKLNVSEDTEIISKDGKPYKGELKNKNLVVIYNFTTRSIPAQTNPIKVIVLDEEKAQPTQPTSTEQPKDTEEKPSEESISSEDIKQLVVDGKVLDTNKPFVNNEGVVMVPLRAVSEALNYSVKWNEEINGIMLDNVITLKVGEDYYTHAKATGIELGTAPVLVDGVTYVPLKFFKEVTQMNNAYVFEGQVIINNDEKQQ